MFRQFAGPISLACTLVVCWNVDATVTAQQKSVTKRPVAPSRSRKPIPRVQSRPQREAEPELERLPPDPAVEAADISITANVRARSLIFETVPNPTVEFPGRPARDTVWEATRENLPTPVEPGVTYRNIGIRLKITSVFRDIDRIVAEALGEVPLTDDLPTNTVTSRPPSIAPKAAVPSSQSTSSQPPLTERP